MIRNYRRDVDTGTEKWLTNKWLIMKLETRACHEDLRTSLTVQSFLFVKLRATKYFRNFLNHRLFYSRKRIKQKLKGQLFCCTRYRTHWELLEQTNFLIETNQTFIYRYQSNKSLNYSSIYSSSSFYFVLQKFVYIFYSFLILLRSLNHFFFDCFLFFYFLTNHYSYNIRMISRFNFIYKDFL